MEALPAQGQDVDLRAYQLARLNEVLAFVVQHNAFYREKLRGVSLPLRTLEDVKRLPFTTKGELIADQQHHPPFGRNHTFPETRYIRYHQTSGTTGRPLKVLDTEESWAWWQECWLEVLRASGITASDRLFLAFSFGPFIGFWAAYEAGKKAGALVIPGGGQSSAERVAHIFEHRATVLLCTPSYALHLAETARQMGYDPAQSSVRLLITAGEPGGSIPSVRENIERLWGAALYDHVGMTEMGAYGYSCARREGIHVNERQFFAEIVHPQTLEPVADGEVGELVLTNFGRLGYPLIRYRTGDLVRRADARCACGRETRLLPGGVLGRVDDMVVIRGVNIYPQSLEAVIREFPEVAEFRIVYYTREAMDQVKVQVEAPDAVAAALARRLRERIGLRIDVEPVAAGTLPRFEMKARRVVDARIKRT